MSWPWQVPLLLALCAVAACRNPVRSAREDALGPEKSGVPHGPLHRPGQPCTVCHTSGGGAPNFSLAGTVFAHPDSSEPLAGAVVQIIESNGNQKYFTTNAAGNFYVSSDDWSPDFPLWASVGHLCGDLGATYVHEDMQTQIFRASACADCHFEPRGPSSTGRIYADTTSEGLCP